MHVLPLPWSCKCPGVVEECQTLWNWWATCMCHNKLYLLPNALKQLIPYMLSILFLYANFCQRRVVFP
jgi:hypothetical protein